MPELPDVEVYRRYIDSTSLNQTIRDVRTGEKRLLEGISAPDLADRLTGRHFTSTRRHGKHLGVGVGGDGGHLVLHFGMTGELRYFKTNGENPDHTVFTVDFENTYRLAYICTRKLGKIGWTNDWETYVGKEGLGPDPFDEERFGEEELSNLLRDRRGMIKTALMDQSLIAGIGNIYSDEILFHAGIHPRSRVGGLESEDIHELYESMRRVFGDAVESRVEPDRFPEDFLIPRRRAKESCPLCGGKLVKKSIGGRSSWFCEKHQEMKT